MEREGMRRRKLGQYKTYGSLSREHDAQGTKQRDGVDEREFEDEEGSQLYQTSRSSSSSSSSSSLVPASSFQTPNLAYLKDFTQNALYSLTYGLEFVWVSLLFLPSTLSSLFAPVSSLFHDRLTPELESQLRSEIEFFRSQVSHCYDATKKEHEDCLFHLWELSFPGRPLKERETKEWQDLGFQGKDPATDFRGAGIFGLCNLLYFGRRYPASFYSCLHQSSYPFAIAGLSLTNLLFEFLGFGMRPSSDARVRESVSSLVFFRTKVLKEIDPRPPKRRERPLWDDSDAECCDAISNFNELFCFCFTHLDDRWRAENATYMDFPRVLQKTREEIERKFVHEIQNIRGVTLYNEERSIRVGDVPSHIPEVISKFNRSSLSSLSSPSPPSSPPSSPSSRVSTSLDGSSSPLIDLSTPAVDEHEWSRFDDFVKEDKMDAGEWEWDNEESKRRNLKVERGRRGVRKERGGRENKKGKGKDMLEREGLSVCEEDVSVGGGYLSLSAKPSLSNTIPDFSPFSSSPSPVSLSPSPSSSSLSSSSPLIDGL